MSLSISHTHEAGSLLDGTSRGDGSNHVLKRHGWRWSRSIECWYLPHSRDRMAKTGVLHATATELRAHGFDVAVDINDTPRVHDDISRAERARDAARLARLERRAEAQQRRADQAAERLEATERAVPPGGEPIKIGHHSEKRHRAAIENSMRALHNSVEADRAAERARARADIARRAAEGKVSPQGVVSRLEQLRKRYRQIRRRIDGSSHTFAGGYVETTPPATGENARRLQLDLERVESEIAYWQGLRDAQVASGEATNLTRESIHRGDRILYRREWYEVIRTNPKSVSVRGRFIDNVTIPYARIEDRIEAAAQGGAGELNEQSPSTSCNPASPREDGPVTVESQLHRTLTTTNTNIEIEQVNGPEQVK